MGTPIPGAAFQVMIIDLDTLQRKDGPEYCNHSWEMITILLKKV